jgi:hypothetical protein
MWIGIVTKDERPGFAGWFFAVLVSVLAAAKLWGYVEDLRTQIGQRYLSDA